MNKIKRNLIIALSFGVLALGAVGTIKLNSVSTVKADEVLKAEFPEYKDVVIQTPDEWTRRVGQSIAAASLPEIKK